MENIDFIEFGLKIFKVIYDAGGAILELLIDTIQDMGNAEDKEQAV
jgi:hypothetical protein|tara:strand:+ start:15211 stop:15348 length:138 start_codon:yes stop_codon:yes gene_type:complete